MKDYILIILWLIIFIIVILFSIIILSRFIVWYVLILIQLGSTLLLFLIFFKWIDWRNKKLKSI